MEWELDTNKIPISPKERGAGWLTLLQEVKKDMQSGLITAWGAYLGEMRGFSVFEGSDEEISMMVQKYVPFVYFTTHPAATVDQLVQLAMEMQKSTPGDRNPPVGRNTARRLPRLGNEVSPLLPGFSGLVSFKRAGQGNRLDYPAGSNWINPHKPSLQQAVKIICL